MTLPPLEELVNVLEVEDAARAVLSRTAYDRIAQGAGAGLTLRRNREAFDRITFRPRMLVDVSRLDLSTELFGERLYAPILVAPMARHRRAHADAELATVQGAGAAKTICVVSGEPSVPFDQIVKRATAPLWSQSPADAARGAKAILLNAGPGFDWDTLRGIKGASAVPVLLKGVLSPDQALAAIDQGAQGLVVSNFGGRIVDGLPPAIDVLPRITEAVGGRVPVLVDGGFRRGTDILKALALGAKAVLVGRPILYGLAAYGADGVRAVLEMLQSELALCMGHCGKPNLASIDRSLVKIHRR
jgi:isopentenyl diphosphate isomerase/L-lactate dehydrogenase-like FMN-dependent dehydrogenase